MTRRKPTDKEIERVAKAIEQKYHRDSHGPCDERDGGPDDCWKSMIGFAKAAILAMRSKR